MSHSQQQSGISNIARIALTPGEPAGVGPELVVRLAQQSHNAQLVAIADPELLYQRAAQLGLPLQLDALDLTQPASRQSAGHLSILPQSLARPAKPGHLDPANSPYVINSLNVAARGCLSADFDAMVTAPVHKAIINEAKIPFTGHTELLQQIAQVDQVVMLLACQAMKVALVTTHVPLQEVAGLISAARLEKVINILHRDFRQRFATPEPRIMVLGLNPHAGESGHLGREEIEVISPVIEQLQAGGYRCFGPMPADTAFNPKQLARADVVLAMYHDQGLPVLKYAGFGAAANITLGLPFVRTSVDHGTALDIAGQGIAEVGSLQTALDFALQMSQPTKHSVKGSD